MIENSSVYDSELNQDILDELNNNDVPTAFLYTPPIQPVVCFNEGSKILCLKNDVEMYEPIENLRNGDLIKTIDEGFKPIVMIGKSVMYNRADDKRIKDQLYIYKERRLSGINRRFNYNRLSLYFSR